MRSDGLCDLAPKVLCEYRLVVLLCELAVFEVLSALFFSWTTLAVSDAGTGAFVLRFLKGVWCFCIYSSVVSRSVIIDGESLSLSIGESIHLVLRETPSSDSSSGI